MYAVIETGGKQHIVELGTELEVELLEAEPGQDITLDRVLLVVDDGQASVGRPLVADAAVSARVLRQDRGEKVISFKYRPKARSRVKKGHRQELTILRITDVRLGDKSAAGEAVQAASAAQGERERLAEAAARQAAEDAALAAKLAERTKAAQASAEGETATPRRRRGKAEAETETEAAAGVVTAAEGATEAEAAIEASGEADDTPEAPTEGPAPRRRSRAKKDE